MTDENLQSSDIESSPDLQTAETSLDNALAALKTGKEETKFTPSEPDVEEPEDNSQEQPERKTLKLPEKKFVETDEPEVQRRINELYKNSKISDERNALLTDELLRVATAAEERENFLLEKLQKIEGRHIQQDEEQALSGLRQQYNDAIQNLDYETATKINEKIIDFKTEQKVNGILNAKNTENNLKQVKVYKPAYSDPQDVVDADRFQSEKSTDGSLLRPWLREGHPEFQNVVDMMAAVSNGFIRKNQRPSLSAVMKKVDTWMGLGNQKGSSQKDASPSLKHPPVLSSNTVLHASSDNKAQLSDLEKSYSAKLGLDDKSYAKIKRLAANGPISMDNFKK